MSTYRAKTSIGTIQKTSKYRKTYDIISVNRKFRKIKFKIEKIYKNDTILVETHAGIKETHYRVKWKPVTVAHSKENKKKFNEFFEYWQNDMSKAYRDDEDRIVIEWRDSYVPLKDMHN